MHFKTLLDPCFIILDTSEMEDQTYVTFSFSASNPLVLKPKAERS